MPSLLEKINTPSDLKDLSIGKLKELAEELRTVIIQTVAKNGGHLASNLGVVELTIALHYVFNAPEDKIIWDVGHQCYAHKLLTGRYKNFSTLRKEDGIAGFPKREESIYDVFNTGHASTALSAGLGFAICRDKKKQNHKIVCVIGDGALGGGLALEALNHIGHIKEDMIVILNSNELAISKLVGSIGEYLSKLITSPLYNKMKDELEELIKMVPRVGHKMLELKKKLEELTKGLLLPGTLFEELGYRYIGPLDGHNVNLLIHILNFVKQLKGPLLVHVITKKGKGYTPAEEQPEAFHGTAPFNIISGKPIKEDKKLLYSEILGEACRQLCSQHEDLVFITAAMAEGTGLYVLKEEFDDRLIDVGIAEEHATTLAAGMAAGGLKPIVCIYSTFLQRAYDQILHDVCLQNLPVIFLIDRAGIVGEDGTTHHGIFDISFLRHMPNMKLFVPTSAYELISMLKTAIINTDGPVGIRYPKAVSDIEKVPDISTFPLLDIGKAEIIKLGNDGLMLPIGSMVAPAIEAAKILAEKNINLSIINPRFIKPLDEQLIIAEALKTEKIITIEEHVLQGGFGSAVLELLQTYGYKKDVLRIGLPDTIIGHGPRESLLHKYGLTADKIAEKIFNFINK